MPGIVATTATICSNVRPSHYTSTREARFAKGKHAMVLCMVSMLACINWCLWRCLVIGSKHYSTICTGAYCSDILFKERLGKIGIDFLWAEGSNVGMITVCIILLNNHAHTYFVQQPSWTGSRCGDCTDIREVGMRQVGMRQAGMRQPSWTCSRNSTRTSCGDCTAIREADGTLILSSWTGSKSSIRWGYRDFTCFPSFERLNNLPAWVFTLTSLGTL